MVHLYSFLFIVILQHDASQVGFPAASVSFQAFLMVWTCLDMFGHVWTNDGFTYHMESYGSWDSLAQRPCSMAPSKSDASRRGRPASLSKMRH